MYWRARCFSVVLIAAAIAVWPNLSAAIAGAKSEPAIRASAGSLAPLLDVLRETADASLKALTVPKAETLEQELQALKRLTQQKEDLDSARSHMEQWLSMEPVKAAGQSEATYRQMVAEHAVGSRHETQVLGLLKDLGTVGRQPVSFVRSKDCPVIRFAWTEKGTAVLLAPALTAYEYNTLRTTQKHRAARTVEEVILPILPSFHRAFQGSDVAFYGMAVFYSCSEFGEPPAPERFPEGVALVVSAPDCQKLVDASITQEELMARSSCYLLTSGPTVTKAALSIE